MGWKTELLDASFRGVTFEVESVQDDGEKSIVVHEYPYRAGAEIEDLGRKARRIRITALFWGEDYLSGVSALVKAFEETGKGELIHPVFGSVQVAITRWGIPHKADDPDYVALDFEAVEAELDNPFFDYQSPRAGAEQAQASLDASIADALSSAASTVRDKLAVAQEYAQAARARVENVLSAVPSVEVIHSWGCTPVAFNRVAMVGMKPSRIVLPVSSDNENASSSVILSPWTPWPATFVTDFGIITLPLTNGCRRSPAPM